MSRQPDVQPIVDIAPLGVVIGLIGLDAFENDAALVGGIRAGARGFLLKGVTAETPVEAIRAVAAGGSFLYAPLAAGSDQSGTPAEWQRDVLETPDRLTSREREVLKLLTSGISNPQIAAALNLGEGTVKTTFPAYFPSSA